MARKTAIIDAPFPLGGIHLGTSKEAQPQGTTAEALNVRAWEMIEGRARGGQRAGLSKYSSARSSANRVQLITHMVTIQTTSPAAGSISKRTITPLLVCNGTVASFDASSVTTVTSGSGALSSGAPIIFATQAFDYLYFADGVNAKRYNAGTNTVGSWTPSVGSLPSSGGRYPRLIELWNARIVMSGLQGDDQNWFMSASGDPLDWDYSPNPATATQAVAGNNSDVGKIGDVITSLIPFSESNVLIFGGDHSIWMLRGDPMDGGRLDMVSTTTGVAWGRAWCIDPAGVCYFFGSRGGVYRMSPGSQPERITAKHLEAKFASVDLNLNSIRLAWNDQEQGVHLFITRLDGLYTTEHFFYDVRNQAWWIDTFADENMNPVAVHVFDGDSPDDRVIMVGGEDGYVRYLNSAANNDDGEAIESRVLLGPIRMERQEFVLSRVYGVLAESSDDIDATVFVGDSAEQAYAAAANSRAYLSGLLLSSGGHLRLRYSGDYQPSSSGTLSPTKSNCLNPRRRARCAYVELSNSDVDTIWAVESITVEVETIPSALARRRSW